MSIKIIDECGLLKQMKQFAVEDMEKEHGAIAILRKKDTEFEITDCCMIEEVGGEMKQFSIVIPTKISYLLLEYCEKQQQIPFIVHTHTVNGTWKEGVDFSPQDISFIDEFVKFAKDKKIAYCLFAVIDYKSQMYCLHNLKQDNRIFTREQQDDK